ncbi:MAG: acyl-CoA dehydrogenase family protein [Negativicutes bacterium]|nr:acyl-CoA dehydrogenase family protein [Negativicutes bacterium]
MGFELNETQAMIRETVRDFARTEVAPLTSELDKKGEFPWVNYRQAVDLGLLGMTMPEELGGIGADAVSFALAIEEMAWASASLADTVMLVDSLCYLLYHYGSASIHEKYLKPIMKGKMLGSFGVTEPEAGTDVANIQTTAVKDGKHWVLNGTKAFINNAPLADMAIIFAVTDTEKRSHGGMTAFVVEKGMTGLSAGKQEDLMGQRSLSVGQLFMENVKVPEENILGEVGQGFRICMSVIDSGRIEIGALALGIAQAALDESLKYSKERIQFGQTLSQFQITQWKLASMATEIEASRLLVYNAACLKDQGKKYGKQAAMAKLFASDTAVRAVNEAVQIHGGYGYSKEYVVERLYRDAKITQIYEGTNEIQRLLISRYLLKE